MRRNFKRIKRNTVILFFAAILAVSQMIACSSTQSISKTESSNLDGESNNKPEMPPSMDNERPNPPDMNGERPTPPNGFGGGPNGGPSDGPGGMPGGGNSKPDSYEAINVYDENQSVSGLNIESTKSDESAILVENSANVNIDNFTINRKSSDSTGGDSASFYGVGASALVTDGTLTLSNGTITTDSKGGAGVFAYDKGIAYVNDVTINTEQDTSGGIHVAGGGTLYATNVTATTNGGSSAAIRSDRGGGTMVVNGGTFISHGAGSPALYCTADITVNDATLVANGSEGICIEGLNTTTLKNVDLTSNMPDQSQNDNTWSVIVYQSMSGDSKIGKGTFNMDGGTLTSKNGGIFYTTNTESEFNITNVDLKPSDDFEFLLQATGNNNKRGWGTTGKNGANCTFNANYQEMNGKIIYDSISTLNLNLLNETTFTGAILNDESFTGGTVGSGTANVTIDDNSKWIVTENSKVTSLTLKGSLIDIGGNNVKVVDTNGNVLRDGSSEYVVTVDNLS